MLSAAPPTILVCDDDAPLRTRTLRSAGKGDGTTNVCVEGALIHAQVWRVDAAVADRRLDQHGVSRSPWNPRSAWRPAGPRARSA